MMRIAGACHCGTLRFALHWPDDAATIPARACGCTFCTKHGAVWTSHPGARLQVSVSDAAHWQRYAFGTKTADFHVCGRCGVPVVAIVLQGVWAAIIALTGKYDQILN